VSPAILLWRIATEAPDYGAADLQGKGAERTGGRWNRVGIPMVYASTTRSLACLETVVHLGPGGPLPLNRYLVRIGVPRECWKVRRRFGRVDAHVGWDAEPPGRVSQDWGSAWARENKILVAEVPSIIVEEESNILINPRHVDSGLVTAHRVRKWLYDPRLGS
jgi:RES domain-containing protein